MRKNVVQLPELVLNLAHCRSPFGRLFELIRVAFFQLHENLTDSLSEFGAVESKAAFVGAKFFGRIGRLEFFTALPADVRRGCFFFGSLSWQRGFTACYASAVLFVGMYAPAFFGASYLM